MRKKLIIAGVVLVLILSSGVWLPFVTYPMWLVAYRTHTTYGWPEVVNRTEGPSCGGPCAPGTVHRYFKKDCFGVVLRQQIMDGQPLNFCIGAIGDAWEEMGNDDR